MTTTKLKDEAKAMMDHVIDMKVVTSLWSEPFNWHSLLQTLRDNTLNTKDVFEVPLFLEFIFIPLLMNFIFTTSGPSLHSFGVNSTLLF